MIMENIDIPLGLVKDAIIEFYGFADSDGTLIRDEIIATPSTYMLVKLKHDVGVEITLPGSSSVVQPPDLLAQRRLRDEHLFRRVRERPGVGQRHEVAQVPQLHALRRHGARIRPPRRSRQDLIHRGHRARSFLQPRPFKAAADRACRCWTSTAFFKETRPGGS